MEIEVGNNDKHGCIDIGKHPITGQMISIAKWDEIENTKFQVLTGVDTYKTPNEPSELIK